MQIDDAALRKIDNALARIRAQTDHSIAEIIETLESIRDLASPVVRQDDVPQVTHSPAEKDDDTRNRRSRNRHVNVRTSPAFREAMNVYIAANPYIESRSAIARDALRRYLPIFVGMKNAEKMEKLVWQDIPTRMSGYELDLTTKWVSFTVGPGIFEGMEFLGSVDSTYAGNRKRGVITRSALRRWIVMDDVEKRAAIADILNLDPLVDVDGDRQWLDSKLTAIKYPRRANT